MMKWSLVVSILLSSALFMGCDGGEDFGNPDGSVASSPESVPSYVMVRRGNDGRAYYSQMNQPWTYEDLQRRGQDLDWRQMDRPHVIDRGQGYPERQERASLYFVEDPTTFIDDSNGYQSAKRWHRYPRRRHYPRHYRRYNHYYPHWSNNYNDYYSWYYSYNWYYQPAYYWNANFYYYSPCSNWNVYSWGGYTYYCYYWNNTGWW